QFHTLLSARQDGALGVREAELLEVHLADCPACRAFAADLARQDTLLRSAFAARSPAVAAVARRAFAQVQARAAYRPSAVVVDDGAYLLPTREALLERDFGVCTAGSADGAQALLESRPFDVLLTDQRMPRRTGVQLLEWARAHRPRTVRLLMTGYS